MKKKSHSIFNIGTSSILLIFVILCLVTFAMLAIVNAKMDYQLSEKSARHTSAYYQADNRAKQILSEVDDILYTQYQQTKDINTFFNAVQTDLSIYPEYEMTVEGTDATLSYSVPVDEKQFLMVSLTLLYPEEPNGGFYRIDSWTASAAEDWQGDSRPNLY